LPAGGPAAWRPGRLASWGRAGPGAAACQILPGRRGVDSSGTSTVQVTFT